MHRRIASYLLGAFVCIQLVYLPLANLLQRVPRRPDPLPDEIVGRHQREGRVSSSDSVQSAIDVAGKSCDRWAEATGQAQGWSLFAPRFGEAGTFLTLDALAADGTWTELRSRFEPADPSHYVRYDVRNYRLFYREMSYALRFATWTPDSFATRGEEWRAEIHDLATVYRRSLAAYVRWRLATELPDAVIREVTIKVRIFLPPRPGDASPRPAPVAVPIAKWRPETPDQLMPFDPVTGQFVRVGVH
jgi:hypothetical protein